MFVIDRLHSLLHRTERRNLASALIGEIVAVLRAFEVNRLVEQLEVAANADGAAPKLNLPPFVAYKAIAQKIDRFSLPLPRQIVFFYTRLSVIEDDLRSIIRQSQKKMRIGKRSCKRFWPSCRTRFGW